MRNYGFPDLSEEGHSDVSKNNFGLFIVNTSEKEGGKNQQILSNEECKQR